jgi:hypothetical protein
MGTGASESLRRFLACSKCLNKWQNMKTTLAISVVVNALLLGWLVLLWQHHPTATLTAPVAPARVVKIQPQLPVPSESPVVKTGPFRWSQFESTNGYLAFVANLRAAGCPEATMDDIVQGDTARAYAVMRERLGVSANAPGRWSGQAQAQMAAYFLGQTSSVAGIADGSATGGQNNQATDRAQSGNAALAVFLQKTDFTTPGMSAEQQQEIAGLRQGLLAQITAAGQSPNNHANTLSMSGSDNMASPQAGGDSSQTSRNNPQAGTDNSQTTQGTKQKWYQASPAMLQAEEQESILGGLFGIGAAVQYDQSQASPPNQQ